MSEVPQPAPTAAPAARRTRVHRIAPYLHEGPTWALFGAAAVSVLLLHGVLEWFSVRLDVPDPSRSGLQGILVLYAVLTLAATGAAAWLVRERYGHAGWFAGAYAVGALVGALYGWTTYPEDFIDGWIFGRLYAYGQMQWFVLLPVGVLTWGIVAFRAWRLPHASERLTLSLLFAPLVLQVGLHTMLLVAIWSQLDGLIETARQVHEAPGLPLLFVLSAIASLAVLRRRA